MVHIYEKDGVFYPSVTTVIGAILEENDGILKWRASNKDWESQMNKAAIIGTIAHYRILNELAPQPLEFPDIPFSEIPTNALNKVEMCQLLWDDLGLKIGHPRKVEKFLINHEYRFAGKMDLVAPIDGVYTLLDLKTSKEIRENHKIQAGGYHVLLDRVPEQAMLVSLHPNERGNKFMRAHTETIPRKELDEYGDRFIEMVSEFHRRGLTEKLRKTNGVVT